MHGNCGSEIASGDYAPSGPVSLPRRAIRVVDWNVGRGLRLDGILEFLSGLDADLILLQEVDLNAHRTRRLDIAREIARKLRMNFVFGREFEELTQGSRSSPAYHGQATLSRWPLSNTRILRFRRQSSFWRPRWFIPDSPLFQARIGGRMALVSEVCVAGTSLMTYNLHLESRGDDQMRISQLEECLEDVQQNRPDTALILAGDLNLDVSRCAAATRSMERAQFRDAAQGRQVRTTPSRGFFGRGSAIDGVFMRGPIRATDLQVHTEVTASDHYPLSLELTFT